MDVSRIGSAPELMLAGGVAMLIFLLWRRSRRYFRRSASRPPAASTERGSRDRPGGAHSGYVPRDADSLHVELHDAVRDMKGELDSKMVALGQLCQLADERIARLEELLRQAGGAEANHHEEPAGSTLAADRTADQPPVAAGGGAPHGGNP